MYRQRKLKEQEQLAEQEAMLRAQLQQEEMMLLQQQYVFIRVQYSVILLTKSVGE